MTIEAVLPPVKREGPDAPQCQPEFEDILEIKFHKDTKTSRRQFPGAGGAVATKFFTVVLGMELVFHNHFCT